MPFLPLRLFASIRHEHLSASCCQGEMEKETTRQKEETGLTSRCQKSQIFYLVCVVFFLNFCFLLSGLKIRESTLGKRKCSKLA